VGRPEGVQALSASALQLIGSHGVVEATQSDRRPRIRRAVYIHSRTLAHHCVLTLDEADTTAVAHLTEGRLRC
jgi:hypothetical protein